MVENIVHSFWKVWQKLQAARDRATNLQWLITDKCANAKGRLMAFIAANQTQMLCWNTLKENWARMGLNVLSVLFGAGRSNIFYYSMKI